MGLKLKGGGELLRLLWDVGEELRWRLELELELEGGEELLGLLWLLELELESEVGEELLPSTEGFCFLSDRVGSPQFSRILLCIFLLSSCSRVKAAILCFKLASLCFFSLIAFVGSLSISSL
jgi:hypothetical protein